MFTFPILSTKPFIGPHLLVSGGGVSNLESTLYNDACIACISTIGIEAVWGRFLNPPIYFYVLFFLAQNIFLGARF